MTEDGLQTDELLAQVTEVAGYKVLPPCVVYAKIGQGGMGRVYRARHLGLGELVAVKFLIDEYGRPKFAQLYKAIKTGARIDDALQSTYGFNQEGLYNAWRKSKHSW